MPAQTRSYQYQAVPLQARPGLVMLWWALCLRPACRATRHACMTAMMARTLPRCVGILLCPALPCNALCWPGRATWRCAARATGGRGAATRCPTSSASGRTPRARRASSSSRWSGVGACATRRGQAGQAGKQRAAHPVLQYMRTGSCCTALRPRQHGHGRGLNIAHGTHAVRYMRA